jgi:hypothetical protein
MNKTYLGIIIIVVIILGFWYYSSSPMGMSDIATSTATTTADTTMPPAAAPADAAVKPTTTPKPATTNTFKSIFAQAGNHQCTYEQVSATGQSTTAIYIGDGKMRAEFRTLSGNIGPATFMVYNGGYLYTWQEGKTAGTKTTIKTVADLPAVIPKDLTSAVVIGTNLNSVGVNCRDWARDAKMFVLPSYVKF